MANDQPRGEAANYYNMQQGSNAYGQPQYNQPQYEQPQHGQPQYGQPQYNQAGPPAPAPVSNYTNDYSNEKPMFNQAFKIEHPKYNDIWAGILVCYISNSSFECLVVNPL